MTRAATHLRDLVVARSAADRNGTGLESVILDDIAGAPPRTEEVTGRLESALAPALDRLAAGEVGDPREFRRAREVLLRETQRTMRKLDTDPGSPLDPRDEMTLEAIVLTDGTRPSLLVRGGSVDPAHPMAGSWHDQLVATADRMRSVFAAVGRVEPRGATGKNYFGTGWVVDASKGLVLTNWHVLEKIWQRFSHRIQRVGTTFRILDDVFIDFVGESNAATVNRFKVVEATPSGVDGVSYARLDAAVLRIEPTEHSEPEPPQAIPVVASLDGPRGNLASFCVVGFPGPTPFAAGVHEGVDWTWVNSTLLGSAVGVKRLAPGLAHRPLGSFTGDPREWVFGHDPTTLGGNSGSPILDWNALTPNGFGLHFAGASVDTNVAHAIARCADELRALGVPVQDGPA